MKDVGVEGQRPFKEERWLPQTCVCTVMLHLSRQILFHLLGAFLLLPVLLRALLCRLAGTWGVVAASKHVLGVLESTIFGFLLSLTPISLFHVHIFGDHL